MRKFLISAVLLLSALPLFSQDFQIDKAHSSANFAVKHMMVSTVRGRFSDISGTIHLDPADITKSSVTAVIKAASVNTDNERRDNDLRSAHFFDVEKYPEIKFESTKVEKRGDQYIAIGNLTIKDVTKQVEIPFSLAQAEARGRKRIGADGSLTINRMDYHVDWDPTGTTVSKDVQIQLDVEAAAPAPNAPQSPPQPSSEKKS